MSQDTRRKLGSTTLVLLALVFLIGVMVSNSLLGGLRLDLTQNKLYTLSDGTRAVLSHIEEPVNLYFFYSDKATADIQQLRLYAARVREMLEEFVANSNGKLVLHEIDPQPFSEEEDRASELGLQSVNLTAGGDAIYFGLAGTNSVGDEEKIPFFQPREETFRFLEYDLAKLVNKLASPNKVVIGLLSGVPLAGGFDPQTQQSRDPWVIYQQASESFEIRQLPASIDKVDDDIDVLWIVHPMATDEKTLYAIDQFVLRGGRALIFVDPVAEIASVAQGPLGASSASSSTLEPLFEKWGVEYSPKEAVVDNRYALSVNSGGFGQRPARHIGLIGLDADALDADDIVTSGLESINVGIAGHFDLADESGLKMTPLMKTSTDSSTVSSDRFQFLTNPEDLLDSFAPTGKQYVIAARLQGHIDSAYPDGPPEESDDDAQSTTSHLESTDDANMIIVADVDILSDRLWVQQQSFLGQQLLRAFADNGEFVLNALDNLSGSADLIGLRSRATFSRPFTKVETLRREADTQFRATEQQLQLELSNTEKRLDELQSSRDDTGSLIMSPEQEAEINRFMGEQVRIRRELRDVRHELDRSIERLGTTLKIVNIAGMPLLVTFFAIGLVAVRARRKSRR